MSGDILDLADIFSLDQVLPSQLVVENSAIKVLSPGGRQVAQQQFRHGVGDFEYWWDYTQQLDRRIVELYLEDPSRFDVYDPRLCIRIPGREKNLDKIKRRPLTSAVRLRIKRDAFAWLVDYNQRDFYSFSRVCDILWPNCDAGRIRNKILQRFLRQLPLPIMVSEEGSPSLTITRQPKRRGRRKVEKRTPR